MLTRILILKRKQPIANAFRCAVHFSSAYGCYTFLPDNIPVNKNSSISFILIRHEKNERLNYYRPSQLRSNAPIPSVPCKWFEYSTPESREWYTKFEKQMKIFDDLEEDEKAKRRERHEKYKDQKTPVSQSNSLLEDWIVQIIHFCTGYRSD